MASSTRTISLTEIEALLDCPAKWDFGYSDTLAGSSLRPKATASRLSAGSAWGEAMEGFHSMDKSEGHSRLLRAMRREEARLRSLGLWNEDEGLAHQERLTILFDRYARLVPPMRATEPQLRFMAATATGTTLVGAVDGITYIPEEDALYVVEYKLRGKLTDLEGLHRRMQTRLYVWGLRKNNIKVNGVIYDEALNEEVKPVRVNKNGSISKVQSCTVEEYFEACTAINQEPDPEVLLQLQTRRIYQRNTLVVTEDDLKNVEKELDTAYAQIRSYEDGLFWPIRNESPMRCLRCDFNDICDRLEPDLIDALYDRRISKTEYIEEVAR